MTCETNALPVFQATGLALERSGTYLGLWLHGAAC
jgi:hypothetical protein